MCLQILTAILHPTNTFLWLPQPKPRSPHTNAYRLVEINGNNIYLTLYIFIDSHWFFDSKKFYARPPFFFFFFFFRNVIIYLLSFRHHLERFFLLGVLFLMKTFCSDWPILSETICLFCFCIWYSNIYPEIKFMAKNWSNLCKFYGKVIFWNFCLRKYFLFFFVKFEFVMFHNNIVKFQKKINKKNLLKICLQVSYPTDFCIICIQFYFGKREKYFIF